MMKKNSNRQNRIASKVQTLCAEILRNDYGDDPVLGGVSLTGAVAHGGLQFVRMFYYTSNPDRRAVQARLDAVTRAVRQNLAAKMDQKYVPEIRFEYDDTLDSAARIENLLNNLK